MNKPHSLSQRCAGRMRARLRMHGLCGSSLTQLGRIVVRASSRSHEATSWVKCRRTGEGAYHEPALSTTTAAVPAQRWLAVRLQLLLEGEENTALLCSYTQSSGVEPLSLPALRGVRRGCGGELPCAEGMHSAMAYHTCLHIITWRDHLQATWTLPASCAAVYPS